MSTCGKCKHWRRPTQCTPDMLKWKTQTPYGTCGRIGQYENTNTGYGTDRKFNDEKACVRDASDDYAVLSPRDDFGCVLFQAPDPPPQPHVVDFTTITVVP